LITCFVGTFGIVFYTGFLASELVNMGMTDSSVGYVYASQTCAYVIMCLAYPYTFEHTSRKLQFVIAMIGFGLCHFMMGPSQMMGLPDSKWITIIGMTVLGLF